jgi:ribonucleoside-diphosphate reductase alpha chain
MAEASGKRLDNLYKTAWTRGLKTTYYLRSLGATQMEKNSVAEEREVEAEPKFCSLLDPECEACQ